MVIPYFSREIYDRLHSTFLRFFINQTYDFGAFDPGWIIETILLQWLLSVKHFKNFKYFIVQSYKF